VPRSAANSAIGRAQTQTSSSDTYHHFAYSRPPENRAWLFDQGDEADRFRARTNPFAERSPKVFSSNPLIRSAAGCGGDSALFSIAPQANLLEEFADQPDALIVWI